MMDEWRTEEHEATVLFADLRGFTGLAEARSPVDVLKLVNRCFDAVAPHVSEYGGVLDKFLGDGLMAVFGVEPGCEDHALAAVKTAQAMQEALQKLAPRLEAEGWGAVGLGIGLETGRVVAGHVGVANRREFTVLGDVVNVASRLTAGAAPGEVVLGTGAAAAVKNRAELEPLGAITIRGRRKPVEAWRVRI
jgi:adenylate cyclase